MRSIIVLTDFSEASFRAAEYACSLADRLEISRIILYHAYEVVITPTEMPVAPVKTDQELYLESMEEMGLMRDRLRSRCPETVVIEMFAEDGFSPETVNQRCQEQKIDMIVMGISGKSGLDRLMTGSITARMMEKCLFPLLMVPEEVLIGREIRSVVFATDLKDIASIPADRLCSLLEALGAEVHVVNAGPDKERKFLPEEKREAFDALHRMLDKYPSHFHFIDGDNVVDSILVFAGEQHASMVIAMPKKHSFFDGIFHRSVSKRLAYNSRIPLLSLPEVR